MKYFWLIPLAILLYRCDESGPLACVECSSQSAYDSLDEVYLQVSQVFDSMWVTQIDTANKSSVSFGVCPDDKLASLEHTKIIKASGSLHRSCKEQTKSSFFQADTFSVVETCLPEIDTLAGESGLAGKWFFYEIETEEGSFKPPCESGELTLEIFEVDSKFYLHSKTHALGGAGGEILIKDKIITTLYVEQSLILPETPAERAFSRAYCNVIVCESVDVNLMYSINNNFLTITNFERDNTNLKLYKK